MKKLTLFVLLVVSTEVLSSSSVLSSSAKPATQPAGVTFTKVPSAFKRDLASAD